MVVFEVSDATALQRVFAAEASLDADIVRERLRAWHRQQEALVGWYAARFDNVQVCQVVLHNVFLR